MFSIFPFLIFLFYAIDLDNVQGIVSRLKTIQQDCENLEIRVQLLLQQNDVTLSDFEDLLNVVSCFSQIAF